VQLGFSENRKEGDENAISYSTIDYLELVDWSGRAIIEGKKGFVPAHPPPILQRLKLDPAQYLNYVKKPRFGFANALGALVKLKAYVEQFEKAFLSSSCSPLCHCEGMTGPVARAFCDRAHRNRTCLYVQDARPSETPGTQGMVASQ